MEEGIYLGSYHGFSWLGWYSFNNACGATLTDAVGLTQDTSTQDNLAKCLVAGGVLAAASYAGATVAIFGVTAGWFYDNISTSSKRSTTGIYRRLINDVYLPYDSEFTQHIHDGFIGRELHEKFILKFASALYTNVSGEMEHFGYTYHLNHTGGTHAVFAESGALDDALDTLANFDGETYTLSKLANTTQTSKTKRGDSNYWVSFTGWGGNTGYEQDLLEWGSFDLDARDTWNIDLRDMAPQVQSCTTEGCYGTISKYCSSIGFSHQQGKEDAIVGEVYTAAYGGLDGDCESG